MKGIYCIEIINHSEIINTAKSGQFKCYKTGQFYLLLTYQRSICMKFMAILALFTALVLTSCETMEGLGRDIQKVGGSLEESAKKD